MNTATIQIIETLQNNMVIDAIVEEQDTYLLLGIDPVIQETKENYKSLIKKMERQKPLQPGQIIIKNTLPVKFVIIIYDIENNPVCRVEWIQASLQNLFKECKKRKINTLLMSLPGIKYGNISRKSAMNILDKTLHSEQSGFTGQVFIFNDQ